MNQFISWNIHSFFLKLFYEFFFIFKHYFFSLFYDHFDDYYEKISKFYFKALYQLHLFHTKFILKSYHQYYEYFILKLGFFHEIQLIYLITRNFN